MRRFVLFLATCSLFALAAPAAYAAKGDTLLTFEVINYTEQFDEASYRGFIYSDRQACLDGRKVTVFRKRGGEDEKVGKTETSEGQPGEYRWSLLKFQPPKDGGIYYAVVASTGDCKGDKTLTYKYLPVR